MISIQNTKNMVGVTIQGDYADLHALHEALSEYLRFYFDHQEGSDAYSCYETLLGLCYDIRHAFQGDRNFMSVSNNHENIRSLAGVIFEADAALIRKERNKFKNGNLYFSVDILYPWAVYYMYTLQAVAEDVYQHSWFENDEFGYTEYRAESDLALIRYFIQLFWAHLRAELPNDVLHVIWDYTRIFNRAEYYFDYSELYIEWLCTYWVKAADSRRQRTELLPLLCLELSSILEEDSDELQEEIDKAARNKNENNPDRRREIFEASIAKNALAGLDLYDNYYSDYSSRAVPYRSMDDLMELIYDHVRDHGPFTQESYDEWLDLDLGPVDWDRLEW